MSYRLFAVFTLLRVPRILFFYVLIRLGFGLGGRPAVLRDGRRHVGRVQERRIIRIDEGSKRQPLVGGPGNQRFICEIQAL